MKLTSVTEHVYYTITLIDKLEWDQNLDYVQFDGYTTKQCVLFTPRPGLSQQNINK
jgi:hypothetical protein